jgi:hypothetical protein
MYKMKDIISFDVKLTPNQKLAQDKLNQVHQLYDEIEKLLGTQGVFKRPHLFMALPKKEPQTNEEWLRSCTTEQLAEWLADKFNEVVDVVLSDASCIIDDADQDDYWYRQVDIVEWLKKPHDVE